MVDKISPETTAQIKQLIKSIDENPKDTDSYNILADILLNSGAADQAKELLIKAQGLVDDPSELTYNLALANYFLGEFKMAITMLDTLPNTDLNLYQKTLAYFKIGQIEKALAFALSIKKMDEHTFELLGDIWLALGDLKTAKQSLENIATEERTAKVWFLLGVTTLADDRVKAEEYFTKSKEVDDKYFKSAKEQYDSYLKLISRENKND